MKAVRALLFFLLILSLTACNDNSESTSKENLEGEETLLHDEEKDKTEDTRVENSFLPLDGVYSQEFLRSIGPSGKSTFTIESIDDNLKKRTWEHDKPDSFFYENKDGLYLLAVETVEDARKEILNIDSYTPLIKYPIQVGQSWTDERRHKNLIYEYEIVFIEPYTTLFQSFDEAVKIKETIIFKKDNSIRSTAYIYYAENYSRIGRENYDSEGNLDLKGGLTEVLVDESLLASEMPNGKTGQSVSKDNYSHYPKLGDEFPVFEAFYGEFGSRSKIIGPNQAISFPLLEFEEDGKKIGELLIPTSMIVSSTVGSIEFEYRDTYKNLQYHIEKHIPSDFSISFIKHRSFEQSDSFEIYYVNDHKTNYEFSAIRVRAQIAPRNEDTDEIVIKTETSLLEDMIIQLEFNDMVRETMGKLKKQGNFTEDRPILIAFSFDELKSLIEGESSSSTFQFNDLATHQQTLFRITTMCPTELNDKMDKAFVKTMERKNISFPRHFEKFTVNLMEELRTFESKDNCGR